MSRHGQLYLRGVSIAVLASLLPYTVPLTINIMVTDLISATLWLTGFLITFIAASGDGWKRWWLLVTAPFALFRALETLFIFLTWKLNGGFH